MAFGGDDFLDVAKALLETDSEAAWRSAISRAYYATFWVARSVVEAGGVPVPQSGGERSHDSLWYMLSPSRIQAANPSESWDGI